MEKDALLKLQKYLQKLFNSKAVSVRGRPKKEDSAEVYMGEEFIGVIFLDDEDGDKSYTFQMAILDFDLEDL